MQVHVIGLGFGQSNRSLFGSANVVQELTHNLPALRAIGSDSNARLELSDSPVGEIEVLERFDVTLLNCPIGRPQPRGEAESHQIDLASLSVFQDRKAFFGTRPNF